LKTTKPSTDVVGEATVQGVACYRVEGSDFEGQATYWIEKTGHHRVIRIEQPTTGRITELMR
jgi:hypothetical protein